ncbi:hypothetical protein PAXRUDRAFT_168009, partial [Paxillus rubicundulus Ve08.2h10]
VIFRGGSPNGSLDHIIKDSPLIKVYRNVHIAMENSFHLQHQTICHAQPDMTKMIQKLSMFIKDKHSHMKKESCGALCSIPDQLAAGIALIQEQKIVSDLEVDTGMLELEAEDFFD